MDVQGLIANGRSWYGRIGLTAGMMLKDGEDVNQQIDIPYPSAASADVVADFDPAMPANAPVPTLFDADQDGGTSWPRVPDQLARLRSGRRSRGRPDRAVARSSSGKKGLTMPCQLTSCARRGLLPDEASDPPAATAGVSIIGVTKTFPGVRALANVDFDCRPGEVHALVGENGSGKSTLIKAASGVLSARRGHRHRSAVRASAGGGVQRARQARPDHRLPGHLPGRRTSVSPTTSRCPSTPSGRTRPQRPRRDPGPVRPALQADRRRRQPSVPAPGSSSRSPAPWRTARRC